MWPTKTSDVDGGPGDTESSPERSTLAGSWVVGDNVPVEVDRYPYGEDDATT